MVEIAGRFLIVCLESSLNLIYVKKDTLLLSYYLCTAQVIIDESEDKDRDSAKEDPIVYSILLRKNEDNMTSQGFEFESTVLSPGNAFFSVVYSLFKRATGDLSAIHCGVGSFL